MNDPSDKYATDDGPGLDEFGEETTRQSLDSSDDHATRVRYLVFLSGYLPGQKIVVPKLGLVIGRDPEADLVVGSARDGTSRQHARVFFEHERAVVEDLGSRNGTMVNGKIIKKTAIFPGDIIRIGKIAFEAVAEGVHSGYHDLMLKRALHDQLTGFFNRNNLAKALHNELNSARKEDRPLTLLMLDLDHFKLVNDTHGHRAGDSVLAELADVLRGVLREGDIPFRFGGEEFLVLLPGTDLSLANFLAEALRSSVEKHVFLFEGKEISVTVSIGLASSTNSTGSVEELVRSVDDALYRAKTEGRNRIEVSTLDWTSTDTHPNFFKLEDDGPDRGSVPGI